MMTLAEALIEFLRPWRVKNDVVGALLTGSRAIGAESNSSDVDVMLVLRRGIGWRERGNKVVSGHLFEYFANTPEQLIHTFGQERLANRLSCARMLAIGQVLFDVNGEVKRLQKRAKREMDRDFPKPARGWVEQEKYFLWCGLRDLSGADRRGVPDRSYLYQLHLDRLIRAYAKFHRLEVASPSKLLRLMTDPGYCAAYGFKEFEDPEYRRLVMACFKAGLVADLEALTNLVIGSMGGFEIDGWKLRGPAALAGKGTQKRLPSPRPTKAGSGGDR